MATAATIQQFNTTLATRTRNIRNCWHELLKPENEKGVMRMRRARYEQQSAEAAIAKYMKYKGTSKWKKAAARIADLEKQRNAASAALNRAEMQHYLSTWEQANWELNTLLRESDEMIKDADDSLFLPHFKDAKAYWAYVTAQVDAVIELVKRYDTGLLDKIDPKWPEYLGDKYRNSARSWVKRHGVRDSLERERKNSRKSSLSHSESAYEQSLGAAAATAGRRAARMPGNYRRARIYGRAF
ncbi:hypothetical protein JCM10908_002205 [Rhodotorula pacifica]|uniref:uncharacterized protein n=1 Tax=Rhodotorula pacifica TaxID=1495444 RepID=UPI00318292E6